VAEWLNAPVLKTGVPQGIVSSNLTASAIYLPETRTAIGFAGFFWFLTTHIFTHATLNILR
jgi:hypothetical protein